MTGPIMRLHTRPCRKDPSDVRPAYEDSDAHERFAELGSTSQAS